MHVQGCQQQVQSDDIKDRARSQQEASIHAFFVSTGAFHLTGAAEPLPEAGCGGAACVSFAWPVA